MKLVAQLAVLFFLGVILNVSNPSKADFVEFAAVQVKKKYPNLNFQKSPGSSGLERILAGFGNMMITNYLNEYTTRKDYFIFSVYELDMRVARDFGVQANNMKVLGVVGQFFPLSGIGNDEVREVPKKPSEGAQNKNSRGDSADISKSNLVESVNTASLEGKYPRELINELNTEGSLIFKKKVLSRLPQDDLLQSSMSQWTVEFPFIRHTTRTVVGGKCKPSECDDNHLKILVSNDGNLAVVLRADGNCHLYKTNQFDDWDSMRRSDAICNRYERQKEIN